MARNKGPSQSKCVAQAWTIAACHQASSRCCHRGLKSGGENKFDLADLLNPIFDVAGGMPQRKNSQVWARARRKGPCPYTMFSDDLDQTGPHRFPAYLQAYQEVVYQRIVCTSAQIMCISEILQPLRHSNDTSTCTALVPCAEWEDLAVAATSRRQIGCWTGARQCKLYPSCPRRVSSPG